MSVGGEVIGTTPFAAPVRVQIGTVTVEVSRSGYRTESVSVIVTANALSRQMVRLQPIRERPQLAVTGDGPAVTDRTRLLDPPMEREPEVPNRGGGSVASKWWFWTLIGVAVAGTSVGVAVAVSSGTTTNAPLIAGDEPVGGVIQTLSLPSW